ncbi:MAG: chromosomal replication initiator protein DnaA [Burkholderiaceae bacterium]|nr:chromosomal replication initiator protein DnaA [Burkholderiaceae bacterium]
MSDRWLDCVAKLQDELPPQQFKPWIKPLVFLGYDESEQLLRIGVRNPLKLNWVRSQFGDRLAELARQTWNPNADVRFELVSQAAEAAPPTPARSVTVAPATSVPGPRPAGHHDPYDEPIPLLEPTAAGQAAVAAPKAPPSPPATGVTLRTDLTLDSFVHGKANQIAISAALQVVEQPGTAYNPLFLYGGVGLGKTHLLHAVGNAICERNPRTRVRYVQSQEYFDEMVRAIQRKTPQEFKQKYQQLDLLLIDDIQFLSGKERTQEEFFYTFESLISGRKQLVITSDTYPRDLSEFQDRLVSRLGSGLIVEIEPPELEMRVAILLKKAEVSGTHLPEDVAFFVAKNLRSNVRELEGALLRVIAFARFRHTPVTIELARDALRDLLNINRAPVSVEFIQKTVADHFKIKVGDMYSKRRPANIARARQVAMYFAKEMTQKSFPEIGEAFGGRDHTTVMHACRKIADLRQHDQDFNRQMHVLEQTLRG